MAQDVSKFNRKSIPGLDTRTNKQIKKTQNDRARAAELGMTYDELFNKIHRLGMMFLKQEITLADYEKMIAELEGKADC
jgi:hypothetical protein